MSFGAAQGRERVGRPTQIHAVEQEERAFDSSGNRLPWALEFPDGYPNPRLARKQPEEKGSFGRSARRTKSSSTRGATRTQTPAAREFNNSLRGFEQALLLDSEKEPKTTKQHPRIESSSSTLDSSVPSKQLPSEDAEPTQIILSGFSTDSQWAAIEFYENVSGGVICEEYDREPPDERKRWHGGGLVSHGGSAISRNIRRSLTSREAKMSMQYRGGAHWVRVTFDSRQAADRAVRASPHQLMGHIVFATPWKGSAPERDEPCPMNEDDRAAAGRLTSKSYSGDTRPANTAGGALSPILSSPNLSSTPGRRPSSLHLGTEEESPSSSATASSGTATGAEASIGSELRRRGSASLGASADNNTSAVNLSASLGRFPQQSKQVIKPATDALLPGKTMYERLWKWLSDLGLVPKDIIGSAVPRKDSDAGDFDWERASYYWMFIKWLDDTLGTDMCGMKDV